MRSIVNLVFFACICINFWYCKPNDVADVDMLPSNVITKITIDKNGVKWIATDKGLVSFDGEKWNTYSENVKISNQQILDIILNGNSLFASTNEGVFKGLYGNQSVTQSEIYEQKANGLVCDSVNKIAANGLRTTIFGTPKGLSILKDTSWLFFDGHWGNKTSDNFLSKNKITGIGAAQNGWVYVSTEGGGVSCFKFVDAVSTATKYFLPWADGLNSDVVLTVVIVDDTCQWYGTDVGASLHTSSETKADWALHYSVEEGGLASDTVYAIAKDASTNTVWFGTHRGVSKLKDNVITNYSISDGLINNKINTLAVDIDGSVWFGTDKGISHFKNGIWKNYTKE